MEPNQLLSLFGVNVEHFALVTGMVYLVVEFVKGKWSQVFLGGWRTDLVGLVVSFLLACKLYYPNWEAVIALGLICWILPAGFHKARMNGKK